MQSDDSHYIPLLDEITKARINLLLERDVNLKIISINLRLSVETLQEISKFSKNIGCTFTRINISKESNKHLVILIRSSLYRLLIKSDHPIYSAIYNRSHPFINELSAKEKKLIMDARVKLLQVSNSN